MDKNKHCGSALISALFIMTLVAIAATAMGTRVQLDIYRTRLTLATDKLYLASQAVTFWAMDTLSSKKKFNQLLDDTGKVAKLPRTIKHIYPPFLIEGAIYDLQAHVNINNLSSTTYIPMLFKLLDQAKQDITLDEKRNVVEALRHWLSPYNPNLGEDPLSTYYLKQKPSYFPAHFLLSSPSEIRLIKGVTSANYNALLPLITALPQTTPININTAPKAILLSLTNGKNPGQINKLIEFRAKKPLKDLSKIKNIIDKTGIQANQLVFESQYFLCVAKVRYEDLTLLQYSILVRNKNDKGKYSAVLLSESLNTL